MSRSGGFLFGLRRARRGAGLLNYALVVGLIAVVAIAATRQLGDGAKGLFTIAGNVLNNGYNGSGLYNGPPPDTSAPQIAAQSFSIREDAAQGALIGTVLASDDVAVTGFTIVSGNTNGYFQIDAAGTLRLTAAGVGNLNASAPPYALAIAARDGANNAGQATVTVTIGDATAPQIGASQSFAVLEDATSGATIGTVAASDNIGVTGFAITGCSPSCAGYFAISPTGVLSLTPAGAGQLTPGSTSTLTVTASDASGATSPPVTITIAITDNTAPQIPSGQSFSIVQGVAANSAVGTVSATDNLAVTGFSITGCTASCAGYFAISAAGELTLTSAGASGIASNTTLTVTIQATDEAGNTASRTVEVAVTKPTPTITFLGSFVAASASNLSIGPARPDRIIVVAAQRERDPAELQASPTVNGNAMTIIAQPQISDPLVMSYAVVTTGTSINIAATSAQRLMAWSITGVTSLHLSATATSATTVVDMGTSSMVSGAAVIAVARTRSTMGSYTAGTTGALGTAAVPAYTASGGNQSGWAGTSALSTGTGNATIRLIGGSNFSSGYGIAGIFK